MSSVTSDSLVEGRFQLREIIGEGGMARVYAAYDKRLLRSLAIKILNPEFARRDSIRRRFLQEARTMATLDDPRVVRIIDYGEEGDRVYIIMELVDGGSLLERVRDHGPLPPRMAAQVTLELCRALEKAHSMGIRHRDVKPHNVLLTREGSIRITDFGIAQVERDDGHGMTRTGAVMGTWGYMAPEQKTDASSVDDRADIYATGATLWALLRAETPPELFMADSEPTMLEGVPDVLAEVIRRSTRYRRDERYPTVRAMADSLSALLPLLPEDPADSPPLVPARVAPGRSSAVDTMIQLGAADGGSSSAAARPPSIATSSGSGMPPHEPTLIPSGRGTLVADDAMDEPPHPLPASNFRAAPTVAAPPPAVAPAPVSPAAVSPASVAPAPVTRPPAWEPPEPEPVVASNGKAVAIVAGAALAGAVLIGVLWLAFGPGGAPKDGPAPPDSPPVATTTPPSTGPTAPPDAGTPTATVPPATTTPTATPPSTAPSTAPSTVTTAPSTVTTAPPSTPPSTTASAPASTPPVTTTATATTPPPPSTTTPPSTATAPVTSAPPSTDPTTTAVDPNSATLVFNPPGSAHVGDSVVFRASIGAGWEVKLFYRAKGSTTWLEKLLVARDGAYTSTLRVDETMAPGVEYFIEATRGSAKVRQGRYSAPLLLDIQP